MLFVGNTTFSNQTVDLLVNNYNLTLNCVSAANYHESHSYKWIRDNKIIYPGHHYITIKSSLLIINLTVADAGNYQCMICDSMKRRSVTKTIQVIIKGMYICCYNNL